MSAAEKLKAIEVGCASWDDGERWADGLEIYIYNGQPPIHLLRNALPQIVAVVEAAEGFVPHMEDEGGCHPDRYGVDCPEWLAVPAALAALDEALGDVT